MTNTGDTIWDGPRQSEVVGVSPTKIPMLCKLETKQREEKSERSTRTNSIFCWGETQKQQGLGHGLH